MLLAGNLLQFVPIDASIKISRLVLRNRTNRIRHISLTAYVEWVLGPSRSASLPFLITETDPTTGALFARAIHGARISDRASPLST